VLRRRRRDWLEDWEDVVSRRLHHWSLLDGDERRRLGELVEWLVSSKRFEAARGFHLDREVVLTVAGPAALLVLGTGPDAYRDVSAVVVHRRAITQRTPRATTVRGVVAGGPQQLLGHAGDRRGPVVLAWSAIRRDLRRPGANVVMHEFAHKIDVASGGFDGTPELASAADRAEWIDVCTREYRRLRRRRGPDPVLRPYAGTSPSEFFAVATEAFFEQAPELRRAKPDLYGVLRGYYRQDPAERADRHAAVGPV
jgi:MtfA peptidase